MDRSPFIALLSTDAPTGLLFDLLQLNGRAVVVLLCCLVILRVIKVSAATRHLLASLALLAVALLPLSSRLIPAFDIAIEPPPPAQEAGVAVISHPSAAAGADATTNLTTADLLDLGGIAVYTLGFVAFLANIVLSNVKLFLLVRLCHPVTRSNWLTIAERHRKNLGIRRRIRLRYSALNTAPSTWGAIRPVILLPASALQWPDHLVESTVLHELAHIKRYDWPVQQITRCICAIYWLNPLCWLAARRIYADAETACDDIAINAGIRNVHYAKSLVDVAKEALQYRQCRMAALAMTSREKHSQLNDRILAVLNERARRAPLSGKQVVLMLSAFVFTVSVASVRANFVTKPNIQEPLSGNTVIPVPAEARPVALSAGGSADETSATRDRTAAMPDKRQAPEKAEQKTAQETGRETDISGFDKLSALKQALHNSLSPPAKEASANRGHTLVELPDEQLKEYLDQQLAFDRVPPEPIMLENTVSGPFRKNLVTPEYPRRALSRGIEGRVTVEYAVDKRGHVVDAQILSASPDDIFNRQVLKAIKQSTFNPRMVDGRPVPAEGLKEIYVFVVKS